MPTPPTTSPSTTGPTMTGPLTTSPPAASRQGSTASGQGSTASRQDSTASRQDSVVTWTVAVLFWVYYLTPVVVRPDRWTFALIAAVPGLVALAVLTLRHRRPVVTALVVGACLAVNATATGAALVVQAVLAHRARRISTVVASATGFLVAKVVEIVVAEVAAGQPARTSAVVFEFLLLGAGLAIATLVGRLRRSREEEVVSRAASERSRQEAERARHEAEQARLAEARLAERARIAREMHDVVAHRISLVAMHAGVLAHTAGDDAGRETARLIQTNAREALAELRVVLADLRDPGDPPEPPQPTLADLPRLVAEGQRAGQRIDLTLSVAGDEVPPRLSRQAYRIVQEGLTNARRHAPGAPVTVEVAGRVGGRLAVEITNPLTVPASGAAPGDPAGTGLGLVGVTERAALLGGSVHHGARDGAYVLTASLPWTASA